MKTNDSKLPAEMLAKIHAVRRRRQRIELSGVALRTLALLVVLIAAATALDWWFAWSQPAERWISSMAVVWVTLAYGLRQLAALRLSQPLAEDAREIDRSTPGSEERWSTAAELADSRLAPSFLGSPELIAKLTGEARELSPRIRPANVVPGRRMLWPPVLCAASLFVLSAAIVLASGQFHLLMQRFLTPWQNITLTRITPDSSAARVLRHSPLELKATLSGRIPKSTTLQIRDEHGAVCSVPLPTQPKGAQSSVQYAITDVTGSFAYRFSAGDAVTDWTGVQAVDRPEIKAAALRITWPAYTKHPDSKWDLLPPAARVLRGSRLDLELTADQPLATAALDVAAPHARRVPLEAAGPQVYRFSTTLTDSLPFQLVLENTLGLRNLPAGCRITVFDDQPPTVKVLDSSETLALRADDTLRIDFEAKDDFAVAKAEVIATTQKEGEPAKETVIPIDLGDQAGQPRVRASVDLDLKRLPLDPSTALSYAVRVHDSRDAGGAQQASANAPTMTANNAHDANPQTPLIATPLDAAGKPKAPSALAQNTRASAANPASPSGAHASNRTASSDLAQNNANSGVPTPSADNPQANRPGDLRPQAGETKSPASSSTAPNASASATEAKPAASANVAQANPSSPTGTNPQSASDSSATPSSLSSASPHTNPSSTAQASPSPANAAANAAAAQSEKASSNVAQNGTPSQQNNPSSPSSASASSPTASSPSNSKPSEAKTASNASAAPHSPSSSTQTSAAKPVTLAQKGGKHGDGQETAASAEQQQQQQQGADSSGAPPSPLNKRNLDVSSVGSSQRKKVRIEQYTGKFDGETREKQSLAIDPVLKALRDAATGALAETDQAQQGLDDSAMPLESGRRQHVSSGRAQLTAAMHAAEELKQKSSGTAYAFFGAQADGISSNGLVPADSHLASALGSNAPRPDLEAAAAKLHWVIDTLDALTKQYATLKATQKAESILQQIKEMHMVFVEDMQEQLKASANPAYQRSMLEVDKEYAKAYEEFLRKRRDAMKQLADLLAQYPELQARFLEKSRIADKVYRDELLRLKTRQEELAAFSEATATGNPGEKALAALWQKQLQTTLTQIAGDARQMAAAAKTWLPEHADADTAQNMLENAQATAEAAQRAADHLAPGPAESDKDLRETLDHLTAFSTQVQEGSAGTASEYAVNRKEDAEKLQSTLTQTEGLLSLVNEHRYNEALTAAQGFLTSETSSLTEMLLQDLSGFAKLSAEIKKETEELGDAFKREVSRPQNAAAEALEQKGYPLAQAAQQQAAQGLDKTVEQLDKLMQKVVEKIDEDKNPGAPPHSPSLDDLVKALQKEKRSAMSLGISCRPRNIQVQTDWEKKEKQQSQSKEEQQKQQQEQQRQEQQQRQRLQAAKESAAQAAKQAALAQQKANERAANLNHDLETATITVTAEGVAKIGGDPNADWNTLPSQLRSSLLQEKGNNPPKRYQDAIDSYFKSIAGAANPDASKAKE